MGGKSTYIRQVRARAPEIAKTTADPSHAVDRRDRSHGSDRMFRTCR
jgi:hypothetical protein